MPRINNVSPPQVNKSGKGSFWKTVGIKVFCSTISLMLALSVAALMEMNQRAKDRRLSAMMVMSNIERFARNLDEISSCMASTDSVATWLLSKPVEELELMPAEELDNLLGQGTALLYLTYDKSTENIFSNSIETWKNMGNVKFIDCVGECFSAMHTVEDRWNKWVAQVEESVMDIKEHPDSHEGRTLPAKCLRNDKVRHNLKGVHYWKAWLSYTAATMRYQNLSNMAAIGITEQEVMEYTDNRMFGDENPEMVPDFSEYYKGPLNPDSLTSLTPLDIRLEEVKAEKVQR